MKNYFLKLFEYDRHTNLQMVENIFTAGQPPKAVQIMAHLLVAQQVWLLRCKEDPAPTQPIWPDWQAVQFNYIIEDNYSKWVNFLNNVNNIDWEREILYFNSKGGKFHNKLVDILAHVINHGTHHRAQIGQIVKQAGLEQLPLTDYILYIRNQNQ